jgi:ribose transport system ATP-binding protein
LNALTADTAYAVRMTGVSKAFGGVKALSDVHLEVKAGEIHALLGGNGAGKSTILKVLRGVHKPDSGTIEVLGKTFSELTPDESTKAGIAMIFQEMSLVPTLTVAQNIFLTNENKDGIGLIDDRTAAARSRELFASLNVDVDPQARTGDLGAGQRQLTEIVKAISRNARILVLDEPSTALSAQDVEKLFAFLHKLRSEGVAIIYVSHRMDEIMRIADRATIFRDGRHVITAPLTELTLESIIEHIVGKQSRGFSDISKETTELGEPLIELRGLSGAAKPKNVDLTIRAGEVVGIAGLLGSGRSALARVLFGIDPAVAGEVRIAGKAVKIGSPADAIAQGIALIPEDRLRQGVVIEHSVAANIALSVLDRLSQWTWVSKDKASALAEEKIGALKIKTASADHAVRTLSGGNQQKVVLGKWLATDPRILILDEPTAGIDIGSKSEIIGLVRRLAREGKAVIVISSELAELLAASDRILVMSDGQIVRDIGRAELDAATAGARDEAERYQLAERQLQLALQNRAQQFTKPLSLGPNGEMPELAANVALTEGEIAQIAAMRAKAAIVLHYGGNDWSRGQVDGLKAQFAAMGIEVIAVTDAGFGAEKQVSDINGVLAKKPDIIVSVPVDPVATAAAYKIAAAQGVKLVFMENTPSGLVAGKDYVSAVSADNYGNGVGSAKLLAEALRGEGEIGLIYHAPDFFVTRQRYEAVKKTLADDYPNIRIVAEHPVTGPDFAAEAEKVAAMMLASHPKLKGIWAVWDVPAEGVIAAARKAGRSDLVVTTIDLGKAVAADMARGGVIKGVGAQRVYDQGVTEALLAGYGLLGKPAPAFVALPALPVTAANLADAWQIVYRQPAPSKLNLEQ